MGFLAEKGLGRHVEADRATRDAEIQAILAEIDSWPKTGLKADKAFLDRLNGDD